MENDRKRPEKSPFGYMPRDPACFCSSASIPESCHWRGNSEGKSFTFCGCGIEPFTKGEGVRLKIVQAGEPVLRAG